MRSSTRRDTTNPEWPSDESASDLGQNWFMRPGGYLVVHHREQELEAEVRQTIPLLRPTQASQVQAEDSGRLLTHNFTCFLGRTLGRQGTKAGCKRHKTT